MEINKTNMEDLMKIAEEMAAQICEKEPEGQNEMIVKIIQIVISNRLSQIEEAQKGAEFLVNSVQLLHGLQDSYDNKVMKQSPGK